jgi:hypothetical protein
MIDRLAIAFACAVFAALTLLAWSVILIAVFGRSNDSLGVAGFIISTVFSKVSLAIVGGAALLGFAIGGDRMVAMFSLLWGTHSIWTRFNVWLGEKIEPLNEEYNVATPWLIAALVVCAVAAWFVFKP